MTTEAAPWADGVVFPALLSAARLPYGRAIQERLTAAGFDDMPRRGTFILGGIARTGPDLRGTASAMGISKQAVSQLVDTLVTRGYLTREPDPDDRRRSVLQLTERGAAAAAESAAAVESVDRALEAVVGQEAFTTARRVLGALSELRDAD